ncbi:MAG: precorrin-2 C(20)-methyltransferase [Atopobiaceae bacterium]|nr:precorrin-2 C(20)-methyltransferase [Atopobiaceae bacterium]
MTRGGHEDAGTLYGVSVGPGDPELMTIKAVRIIREADVVAVPDAGRGVGMAQAIADDLLKDKVVLPCPMPMTHDEAAAKATHSAVAGALCQILDEGKDVAYLCLGDVSIYSSYGYLHQLVSERGYHTEVIPGVTSVSAAAARLGTILCEGNERLVIAPFGDEGAVRLADNRTTFAFLKPRQADGDPRTWLAEHSLLDGAQMVSKCGLADERTVDDLSSTGGEIGYMSVIIARQRARKQGS